MDVNRLLVDVLVWPRLAPDQRSLSYLLTKFLPNSFLGERLSVLCACVCMGLWAHWLESDSGLERPSVCGASSWSTCRRVSEHVSMSVCVRGVPSSSRERPERSWGLGVSRGESWWCFGGLATGVFSALRHLDPTAFPLAEWTNVSVWTVSSLTETLVKYSTVPSSGFPSTVHNDNFA